MHTCQKQVFSLLGSMPKAPSWDSF